MGTFADAEARDRRLRDAARVRRPGRRRRRGPDVLHQQRGVSITRHRPRARSTTCSGGATQGASTLTQQYVERYYVGKTTSDYVGKFKEALLAIKIARQESKDEILGRYLNTIYFGRDSYGIQAAAQSYFGVDAADLTPSRRPRCSPGIIPSPNNWDPAGQPRQGRAALEHRARLHGRGRAGSPRPSAPRMVFPPTVAYKRADTMARPDGLPARDGPRRAHARAARAHRRRDRPRRLQDRHDDPEAAAGRGRRRRSNALLRRHAPAGRRRAARPAIRVSRRVDRPARTARSSRSTAAATSSTDQTQRASRTTTVQAGLDVQAVHAHRRRSSRASALTRRFNGSSPQTLGRLGPTGAATSAASRSATSTWSRRPRSRSTRCTPSSTSQVGPEKTAEVAERAGLTDRRRAPTRAQRARHRRRAPDRHGRRLRDDRRRGRARHDPFIVRHGHQPRRHGRVRARGRREQAFAAGRDRRRDLRDDPGGREGLGQAVDQAARPADRRQDRHLARTTSRRGSSASRPNIVTEVSLSQIGEDGKSQEHDHAVRQRDGRRHEITGATWPAFLWQSYMKHGLRACRSTPTVVEFPPRANVGAKPTATADRDADRDAARRSRPPSRRRPRSPCPSGLEGKLEADAPRRCVNAGLVRERGLGVVGHRHGGPRHPRRPEGRRRSLAPGSAVTLVISTGPKAAADAGADRREPTPTTDAGAGALIHGEGGRPPARRELPGPVVHSRFRRWPRAG